MHSLRSILTALILVICSLFVTCGELPNDPSKEPDKVVAEMSVLNLASGIFQGDSVTIQIIVRYPDLTKQLIISFDQTIPDDTVNCKTGSNAVFDTVFVKRMFTATGTKKILADLELINGTVKSFYCTFNVIEKKLTILIDSVPYDHKILTGKSDTMVFRASTNTSGTGIDFFIESQPPLDTAKLKIIDHGLKAMVIITAPIDTVYIVTVIAQSGTARDTAFTVVTSYTKPVLNEISSVSAIIFGKSDTLDFTLQVKATDNVNNLKLLNAASFATGEIVPVATNKERLSVIFTPSETKNYIFSVEVSVNNVKDTLFYVVSVVKTPFKPWTQDTVTLNAFEGTAINIQLATFLTDTTTVNIQLSADKGTVNGKVLSYIVPNGSSAKDTITVTVQNNSSESSKIMFYIAKYPKFSVSYSGNGNTGGTVPVDSLTFETGVVVTTKTNTGLLVKTGVAFTGWNTLADGTGVNYSAGSDFVMGTENVHLYAKWSIENYTIKYYLNGGTNDIGNAAEYNVSSDEIILANASKTGYTFEGWFSDTAYSTRVLSIPKGSVGNKTLWAKWTINSYIVSFESNGGSVVTNQSVANNSVVISTVSTKTGFVFAGWYTDAALTNVYNFTTPVTNAIILYAKWTPVYEVKYNGNGNTNGTVPTDVNTYNNGVIVTVLENAGSLIRTGYSFDGWYTNAAGAGGTARAPGSTFQMGGGNITLYAKWLPNAYVVNFDNQGATNLSNPSSITITTPATKIDILPVPPTKNGYIFGGWWTSPSGGGTQFTASTPVFASVTVYANWEIHDADGNVYTEVKIGTQVWIVENLRTTKFNDGASISLVEGVMTDSVPRYCYYGAMSVDSIKKFGALYNWYAVDTKKLAPSGWRVPDTNDWRILENYLIAEGHNFDRTYIGNKIAKSLSSTTDWNSDTTTGAIGNNQALNNRSNFLAYPGGNVFFTVFSTVAEGIGNKSIFWSSNKEGDYYACSRMLLGWSSEFTRSSNSDKGCFYSIRLIKE